MQFMWSTKKKKKEEEGRRKKMINLACTACAT
jgi:hypothetical protein